MTQGRGCLSTVQHPDGISIHRDYTSRGQLKTVKDSLSSQPVIDYNYLADGKVDHADYRNGVHCANGYDGRRMISSIQETGGDRANLSSHTYYRDARDRITSFQKGSNNPRNPMEDGRGDHYWYDAEGQLTDAYYGAIDPVNSPNNPVRVDYFPYDALGNRQGWNLLASRGSWLNFNTKDTGLNQYSGWWPYCFTKYDDDLGEPFGNPGRANGVLMEEGSMAISYNALNQPKLAWSSNTQGGGAYLWFGFDPLGRCVKRWYAQGDGSSPTPVLYFVYDGWNLVQEGTSPWSPSHFYFHGARVDEIVASYNGVTGVMAYHYYDASGHCTMLTDWQGNIMEQYYYDAFGYPYFFDGLGNGLGYSPHGNRFLFTGREWIEPLKVYDFRNRLYHPELGRFMQPDPKEFAAGDYNLYRYCHNDPVNKSDPTGLNALFLVGQNRDNPDYFTKIATKWAKEYAKSHKGETASVVQVRSKGDVNTALKEHANLDRVDYVGHASAQKLYLSDTAILYKSDVASLPTDNVKSGASIMLSGCHTGDGSDSIAEAFANRFGHPVIGVAGGISFGLPGINKITDATNSIPRSQGTFSGIPYIFVNPSQQ